MTAFLLNILLALIWAAATESFSLQSLIIGFIIGYVILLFSQSVIGQSNYSRKVRQVIGLFLFFIWQLVLSSLRVAYDVITPNHYSRPGIVAIPLNAETDMEITILANMISLTPGTLSLDVSDDRKVLYIHAMYIDDVESLRHEIKAGFERRVLEVMR